MTTLRRATVDDAPAIAAFQKAEGYNWNIWQQANVKANIAAGDHVHIMLAEDDHQLVGFIHWVETQRADGPAAWFVGAIVTKTLPPTARLAQTHTLALLMGPALGMKGRWLSEANKEDTEAVAYGQMVLPDVVLDLGNRIRYEGDIAATHAHITAALSVTP